MADVGLLSKNIGKQIINNEYKGFLYVLFVTGNCQSCAETMEKLGKIIYDTDFNTENLYIVEKEYFTWIGLVKKFKPQIYPCLIKTFDSKFVERYTGENIIKMFQTGLKEG